MQQVPDIPTFCVVCMRAVTCRNLRSSLQICSPDRHGCRRRQACKLAQADGVHTQPLSGALARRHNAAWQDAPRIGGKPTAGQGTNHLRSRAVEAGQKGRGCTAPSIPDKRRAQ
eukprot:1141063-Pelagomonas_calceolata.AAC.6